MLRSKRAPIHVHVGVSLSVKNRLAIYSPHAISTKLNVNPCVCVQSTRPRCAAVQIVSAVCAQSTNKIVCSRWKTIQQKYTHKMFKRIVSCLFILSYFSLCVQIDTENTFRLTRF